MKQRYSLYEIVKPKLSPNTCKRLEDIMRYRELIGESKHEEENL